jgi:hypothetical protein
MHKHLVSLAIAAGLTLAGSAFAADPAMDKDAYKAAKDKIEAQAKADKKACDAMKDNAKDVCQAEAKAKEKIAKAELDARKKGYTPQARHDLDVARAEANYDVAKQKCDEKAGNDKDVCMKDAKVALTTAKSDAKVQYEANKSDGRMSDTRSDASQDKRRAQYLAARERCDAYTGDTKDRCLNDAKNRFNMN